MKKSETPWLAAAQYYKLRKYCTPVPGGQKVWMFKQGGLPHTEAQALLIIEMCEALDVPVSPNVNASFFHRIITRLVAAEAEIRELNRIIGQMQTQNTSEERSSVPGVQFQG